MMRTPTLSLALLALAACSDGAPVPRGKTQASQANGTGATSSTPAVSPEQRLRDLQAKDAAETLALANLRDVNQKLCERLQRLRSECSATYRLVPSAGDAMLACAAGNNATQNIVSGAFEIVWQSDGREYRLLADNNWETNPFGNGTTALTWKPRISSSTEPPRLIDLSKIQIIPKDGGTIPASVTAFSLRVNGVEALSGPDLAVSPESNGYFLLALQRILGLRESPACKVTPEEVKQIADAVAAQNTTTAK